jgi:hypothetical protein
LGADLSFKIMRKPPERPTSLRPQGEKIALPKPTLIIDSMEQRSYSFRRFHKWFAGIERRKLLVGDYSIEGLEDRVARCFCAGVSTSQQDGVLGFSNRRLDDEDPSEQRIQRYASECSLWNDPGVGGAMGDSTLVCPRSRPG